MWMGSTSNIARLATVRIWRGLQYSPLIKDTWIYGIDRKRMFNTIMYGIAGTDMIPWSTVLSKGEINALTDHILAKQYTEPDTEVEIPDQVVTQEYTLKVETLAFRRFQIFTLEYRFRG